MRWVCTVCGYAHDGATPPAACPNCGVGPELFEPDAAAPAPAPVAARAITLAIIGGGVAGVTAAAAARAAAPDARILLFAAETEWPYWRMSLTRFLAGEIGEDALPLHPPEWYAQQRIELRRGASVAAVNPAARRVRLADGGEWAFDRLILATGAQPFVPPTPGVELAGVGALRTLADARALKHDARAGAAFVCIGGGILGIETAGGLARQGARVTILERGEWLMNRQLTRAGGEKLAAALRARGMEIHTATEAREFVGRNGRVCGVRRMDGAEIAADRVVITAGVRPDTTLAAAAGLTVGRGVATDGLLCASTPDIFAAGDVCEADGELYGLWGPARQQGQAAGRNAVGAPQPCGPCSRETVLKVLGISLAELGPA